MRVRAPWTIALLAIAGTAIAADDWKSFQFAEDGFAIEFPEAPVTTNQGFNPQTMVRTHQYYVGVKSYTFMVNATLFRYEAREQIGGDERLLRLLINIFVANCASHSERTILVRGAAAREIHAENCEKGPATMAQYYFVDNWLYQVTAVGPTGMENSIETKHFMESFRIIGRP
jgi:hypothetical protein